MSKVGRALDLLGQAAAAPAAPVRLQTGQEPKLELAWGSFHQGIGSSLRAVFTKARVPKNFLVGSFFKECWVERRIPRRAIVAAALWHIVFIVMPSPRLPAAARHFSSFDNTELTWSGPIKDFPLVDMKSSKPKSSPRGEPTKPLPPEGADAFHPRQRIFTDPVHPNHPRQMLINSAAPLEPPKILPDLPNIVQLQQMAGPARPRLQISQETLAKLRPRGRRAAKVTAAPLPDVPAFDQKLGEIPMQVSTSAPARPKMELNAGAAPRLAPRAQTGDAGPAPEVGALQSSVDRLRPSSRSKGIWLRAFPFPPKASDRACPAAPRMERPAQTEEQAAVPRAAVEPHRATATVAEKIRWT